MSISNLTVHKNTVKKRKRKILGKALISHARDMSQDPDLAGYLIITWDSNAVPNTAWRADENSPVKSGILPIYAQTSLTRILAKRDAVTAIEEDNE